jgi:hypothetical protein
MFDFHRNISPTDTFFVGFCAFGEGWHNYHVSLFESKLRFTIIVDNVYYVLSTSSRGTTKQLSCLGSTMDSTYQRLSLTSLRGLDGQQI